MIVPIIYPSAGEFWLNSNADAFLGYSLNNRKLTNLPENYDYNVTAYAAEEVAAILNLSTPLHLTSPDIRFKRSGHKCVIQTRPSPFPKNSFVHVKKQQYDIYIASPELCFLQAARRLDFLDLVKFGYDLCSIYYADVSSKYSQHNRISFTSVPLLKEYALNNHSFYGSAIARKALSFVRDNSNSPMETRLAMFICLPSEYGGCGISDLEMNKVIRLTDAGRIINGCAELRADLAVTQKRLAIEYNSNAFHLTPDQYTSDMNRQIGFSLAGWKYIPITAGNIKSVHALVDIMNIIRDELKLSPLNSNDRKCHDLYFKLFGSK